MKLLTNEQYLELTVQKEFWLNELNRTILVEAAPEILKWFNNMLMKELNEHTQSCNSSNDGEFASKVRWMWELSKKFQTEFKTKPVTVKGLE